MRYAARFHQRRRAAGGRVGFRQDRAFSLYGTLRGHHDKGDVARRNLQLHAPSASTRSRKRKDIFADLLYDACKARIKRAAWSRDMGYRHGKRESDPNKSGVT